MKNATQWVVVSLIALGMALTILLTGNVPPTTQDEVRVNQHQAYHQYQRDLDQD